MKKSIMALAICFIIVGISGVSPRIIKAEPLLNNTMIKFPLNNSEINGSINIEVEVQSCNCTAMTTLYVDGKCMSDGSLQIDTNGYKVIISHDGSLWEIFHHKWNARSVKNGIHSINVSGKHKQFSDEIQVFVNNTKTVENKNPIPSFETGTMLGAIVLGFMIVRNRLRMPRLLKRCL